MKIIKVTTELSEKDNVENENQFHKKKYLFANKSQ